MTRKLVIVRHIKAREETCIYAHGMFCENLVNHSEGLCSCTLFATSIRTDEYGCPCRCQQCLDAEEEGKK